MEPTASDELHGVAAWLPTGLLALGTEIYCLRTGRSPATDLARFAWAHRPLRYSIMAWGLITGCHVARWPAQLTRFDPYAFAGSYLRAYGREAALAARRDLERARSA